MICPAGTRFLPSCTQCISVQKSHRLGAIPRLDFLKDLVGNLLVLDPVSLEVGGDHVHLLVAQLGTDLDPGVFLLGWPSLVKAYKDDVVLVRLFALARLILARLLLARLLTLARLLVLARLLAVARLLLARLLLARLLALARPLVLARLLALARLLLARLLLARLVALARLLEAYVQH